MGYPEKELKILYKNPNELKLNTRNSRTHSKKQLHQIAKSKPDCRLCNHAHILIFAKQLFHEKQFLSLLSYYIILFTQLRKAIPQYEAYLQCFFSAHRCNMFLPDNIRIRRLL